MWQDGSSVPPRRKEFRLHSSKGKIIQTNLRKKSHSGTDLLQDLLTDQFLLFRKLQVTKKSLQISPQACSSLHKYSYLPQSLPETPSSASVLYRWYME